MVSRPLGNFTYSAWTSAVRRSGGRADRDSVATTSATTPTTPIASPPVHPSVLPRIAHPPDPIAHDPLASCHPVTKSSTETGRPTPGTGGPSLLHAVLRVHALQCTLARRHPVAALQRLFRSALDLGRHFRFDLLEPPHGDSVRLQIFLVHPDRIAFAPVLEQGGGERVARLALVVGRMPSHSERLGDEQRRSLTPAAALGRELRRSIRVEHVVAVEGRVRDAIARRPVCEVAGQVMLVEAGPEGNLIVLDDEDGGNLLDGGEIRALVCGRGVGGAVAHPRQRHARLLPEL